MLKRKCFNIFVCLSCLCVMIGHAQDGAIQTKIYGSLQQLLEKKRLDEGSGYGAGAQISRRITGHLRLTLNIDYELMNLQQADVLDEWDWDYWQDTYIPFLPGIDVAEVNRTLTYTSTDSIYSCVFDPAQKMKDLRLAIGFLGELPLHKKLVNYAGAAFGVSLFQRELHMTEHWTKRFKLDTLSTEKFDYEYQYDLLHFAPPKKGQRFFGRFSCGLRYYLTDALDLDCGLHYIYYLQREDVKGLEKLFNISSNDQKYYPIHSKALITLGITFKY
ncbi:hypothetical protein JXO59_01835 [candidate division KSB1 bacterium]|nr:hypothetical protein [candidate division KSB1 bacterium]